MDGPAADPLYEQIGRRIRTARERAKQSQDQLSRSVGLTRTSIVNIEGGRQRIQIHSLYAIAGALGVEPQILLPPLDQPATEFDASDLAELAPDEREWVVRVSRSVTQVDAS